MSATTVLDVWVIYDRPFDYPEHCVVRRWELTTPKECYLFGSIDRAREFLSKQMLTRLDRFEQDDPKIVETWI